MDIKDDEYLAPSEIRLRIILEILANKLLFWNSKLIRENLGEFEQSVSSEILVLLDHRMLELKSIFWPTGIYFLRAIFMFPSSFNKIFSNVSSSSISGFLSQNSNKNLPIFLILS